MPTGPLDPRTKLARHMRRLAGVLPGLIEEFGTSRNPKEVLDCADAALSYCEERRALPSRSQIERGAMKNVLFVCTHNAGRSQMAQAFFERYATPDIRAESGGLEPAERIHPAVVEAMAEVGIDISERRPNKLTVEMQLHADFAVTLGCEGRCPYLPTHVEDWALPDPAGRPLAEVRSIRDEIAGRVDGR